MLAEDEYSRSQVLQHSTPSSPTNHPQQQQQCPSYTPSLPNDRYVNDTHVERYTSERYAPSERYHQNETSSSKPERFASSVERFGSERSQSDRLPSGERYQGVSERYPLGERPQTSISSDRLVTNQAAQVFPNDNRYVYNRYPERYTPVGSMERFNTRNVSPTSMERYNTLSTDKGRNTPERYVDRYHTISHDKDRYNNEKERKRYAEIYTERPSSNAGGFREKREKTRYQYISDSFQNDRYPPIPCPDRFDTARFNDSSYLEPPSPAPSSDRFIPPPPLSPGSTPTTPNCYNPNTEQYILPPPLNNSPCKNSESGTRRYQYNQEHRYTPDYRYGYGPQNPHVPVERYVPQQQPENYNYFQYTDRYAVKISSNNDPYMRRDLSFQYRLPFHIPQNYQQQQQKVRYVGTPSRTNAKCCQYNENYHSLSKTSPGSSSSSSVASQQQNKEVAQQPQQQQITCVTNVSLQNIQCQNYHQQQQQQQEKGTQCVVNSSAVCNNNSNNSKECVFVSPNLRMGRVVGQCRHSICSSPSQVEYGGGRHVTTCVTPPPPPRACSQQQDDQSICGDNYCGRRGQTSLTVSIWRSSPAQTQTSQSPQQQSSQEQSTGSTTSSNDDQTTETSIPTDSTRSPPQTSSPAPTNVISSTSRTTQMPTHTRAISLPAESAEKQQRIQQQQQHQHRNINRGVNYSQSERVPNRPALERSMSKKEMIKNYIKRETATFFGVGEDNEAEQQNIWLDRRKRMASRAYGPLKEEYRTSTLRPHRRTVSELPGSSTSGQLIAERPDVLPGPSDIPDGQQLETPTMRDVSLRRKDSVARMTWDGLSYVVTTLTRHRPRPRSQQSQWSRSFPADVPQEPVPTGEEATFFEPPETVTLPRLTEGSVDTPDRRESGGDFADRQTQERYTRPGVSGWRRNVPQHGVPRQAVVGKSKISSCLDNLLDNSDRRQYGMGWVGRMFGRTFKKSVAYDENIQEQLDDLEDHRPMFTYWVTIVQILVLFISLVCYGFGPFGIDLRSRSGQVLVTSLSLQQVDYLEPANFWFGPRAADLIHLGAKFAPCMRVDAEIGQEIEKIRTIERETACCIRNDDSGCVQSSKADCSEIISTWKKWPEKNVVSGGRISGSVCGLDPKFCDAPASVRPYEWPDDITKWPICRKTNASKQNRTRMDTNRDKDFEHMVCEIIGHPCCIGIHGQCKITTREYCDFVRGTFHEEASLCSQVSCLNDVCGMLPFYFPETPDQFYRLWNSLFLHAGILQLAVTIVIQYFLMRDLEKLTGSLRICLIYMGSGIAGNLASAIFVPYRADVGPAGSQFGLLACLIVEVLNSWPMLKHPKRGLFKLLSITFVLFLIGLLPWVDNYAHLFGFIFGFLLSYALLPFISFGTYDRQKKIILIWVCLLSALILFIFLLILFYITPVYNCKICSYFNCLPLTRDFCASQNINFKREEPIV